MDWIIYGCMAYLGIIALGTIIYIWYNKYKERKNNEVR